MEKPTSIKIVKFLLILEVIACIIITFIFAYSAFKSNFNDTYKIGYSLAQIGIPLLLSILSLVFLKPLKYKRLELVLVLQILGCYKNIIALIYTLIPLLIIYFIPDAKRYLKDEVKA